MSARLGTLALLLLAALALYGMQRSTPRYLDLTGPIVERGAMGEAVRTRQFDATVQRVQ
ncbi:Putative exported protein, partial [Bordetella bronchiseptica Bbr77]